MMLFFTQTTHAYWANSINVIQDSSQATVLIGSWDFDDGIPEWTPNPDEPYQAGDIVEYNGNFYVRTSRGGGPVGSMFAPDSFLGWLFWDPYD
jgi:hypothetical protein